MSEKKEKKQETKEAKVEEKVIKTTLQEFRQNYLQLEKALQNNDIQKVQKITKQIKCFKTCLKSHHLYAIWDAVYQNKQVQDNLKTFACFSNEFSEKFEFSKQNKSKFEKGPELGIYLQMFLLIFLIQNKKLSDAEIIIQNLLKEVQSFKKHHFDYVNSYLNFYYFRVAELQNQLLSIRQFLFDSYKTAQIRQDLIGESTLTNLILRNYLHYNHYEEASNFLQNCHVSDKFTNELCRFHYYSGRVHIVRLNYVKAQQQLALALAKSPDNTAFGFKVETQKLLILADLLLGNIPNRHIFIEGQLSKSLFAYYKLVQSVQSLSLKEFYNVVNEYKENFIADKNYVIIQRLHQIVLKTGLAKINSSYSKISFADIQNKLQLDQSQNIILILAKAIQDKTLAAEIDYTNKELIINQDSNTYVTVKPQEEYEKRIKQSIKLYDQATIALQYPQTKFEYENNENNEDDFDEDLFVEQMMGDF